MPSPTLPDLSFGTALERDWIYEVNTGTYVSPTWTAVGGITTQQFNPSAANLEDDSDMQSQGAGSMVKTADNATITFTVARKIQSDGVSYDVGQEFLRMKALRYGTANVVQMRVSEWNPDGGPRVEAYLGKFAVGVNNPGGGNTALRTVEFTLNGRGKMNAITHPYPLAGAVPTVGSVAPSTVATAGGNQVVITGSGFTGTTTLSIAGNTVSAGNYVVESDARIVATTPAHAAGAGLPIVVTNATGASSGGATISYS